MRGIDEIETDTYRREAIRGRRGCLGVPFSRVRLRTLARAFGSMPRRAMLLAANPAIEFIVSFRMPWMSRKPPAVTRTSGHERSRVRS
jgi:hypothetical protein